MTDSRSVRAAVLAAGQVSASLVNLAIVAILSRLFDKTDYATYRQSILVFNIAAPLLALGLPQALYFFVPKHRDDERRVVLENLAILAATGAVFALFLFVGGDRIIARHFGNPDLGGTLRLIGIYVVLTAPTLALPACMMVFDRVRSAALFNVLSRLTVFVAVVGAALLYRTPTAAVAGLAIASVVYGAAAFWMLLSAPKSGKWKVSASGCVDQLRYGIPLGLGTLVSALSLALDKVIVSIFFEPEVFAVYANGAMELPLIGAITGSASAVVLADMVGLLRDGNRREALRMWQRSAVRTAGFIYPVFAGLMLLAPELIILLYSATYADSADPFRIYLLLMPIRVAYFGVFFQAAGRSRTVLTYSILTLVANGVLSVVLVRFMGYVGAAWASVFVILLITVPYCCSAIRREVLGEKLAVLPVRQLAAILGICLLTGALCLPLKLLLIDREFGVLLRIAIVGIVYGLGVLLLLRRFGYIDSVASYFRMAGSAMGGRRRSG